MFTVLTSDEITSSYPELIHLPRIVRDAETLWFVKSKPNTLDEEKRDRLAYKLGKGFCNIAEVRLLTQSELDEIKTHLVLDPNSSVGNTFLVKLANSYKLEDLVSKTIEEAVATELVFSIWTRRRDTHADNRSYINGIPIFYDHQTAFLAEPHWAHTTMFFKSAPDYGHPAFWRVKEASGLMTAEKARQADKAWHYVNNISEFKTALDSATKRLLETFPKDYVTTIKEAGFDDGAANVINDFLIKNLVTLQTDVEEAKKIIFV